MKLPTVLLALLLVVALVPGCGGQTPPEPPITPEVPTEPAPAESTDAVGVRLYFSRDEKIGVAGREVQASDLVATQALYAVQALLKGPTAEEAEFGLGTLIPEGTEVLGVAIDDGVGTVDLSSQFQAGGGSLSMQLRVAQVVCTLTQFSEVEKVAFKLDGEPVDAIGGEGVVVSPPVTRADFEDQLPAILVESPVPGQTVSSPMTVAGSSNVFEATHQINVTDPEGAIVAEKTVTATSGTGTRGTWTEQIEYDNPYPGRLGAVICFEYSAKDGSQTNIVEIPVRME